jgi:hypothetical protein
MSNALVPMDFVVRLSDEQITVIAVGVGGFVLLGGAIAMLIVLVMNAASGMFGFLMGATAGTVGGTAVGAAGGVVVGTSLGESRARGEVAGPTAPTTSATAVPTTAIDAHDI